MKCQHAIFLDSMVENCVFTTNGFTHDFHFALVKVSDSSLVFHQYITLVMKVYTKLGVTKSPILLLCLVRWAPAMVYTYFCKHDSISWRSCVTVQVKTEVILSPAAIIVLKVTLTHFHQYVISSDHYECHGPCYFKHDSWNIGNWSSISRHVYLKGHIYYNSKWKIHVTIFLTKLNYFRICKIQIFHLILSSACVNCQ